MYLLIAFICWTGGSLLMRLDFFPGMRFWYELSISGIFAVPFLLYYFIYCYTERRGSFIKKILLLVWLITLILNLIGVFVKHPLISNTAGEWVFEFTITPWAAIPVLLTLLTLIAIGNMLYRSVKHDNIFLPHHFAPLIVGVAVMCIGILMDFLPNAPNFPYDTLACGINAICIYYILYKKRLILLTPVAYNGPIYLMVAVLTMFILAMSYTSLNRLYMEYFPVYLDYKTIVFAVGFSLLTMLLFSILNMMMNSLFIKKQVAWESELKRFSQAINLSLDINDVVRIYKEFIQGNIPVDTAYICIYDQENEGYRVMGCTEDLNNNLDWILPQDNPLVRWLSRYNKSIFYNEFQRTSHYRAMWEEEKQRMAALAVDFILPIKSDDFLTGFTLFTANPKVRTLNYAEINFLESIAAILAIAIKNAKLYAIMQHEAQLDELTNLFNRRCFMERIKNDFELAQHDSMVLMLFNFDDFKLYNELYGTREGDLILQQFAQMLLTVIGERGTVARYSGKEFIVSMPFCEAHTAYQCALEVKQWLNRLLGDSQEISRKFLTFSAGICAYPASAGNMEELLTYVNMAVYSAKKNGKNQIVVYAEEQIGQGIRTISKTSSAWEIGENCAPTIYALTAAIDAKDHYTFNHSINVSEYAAILAEAIQLDREHVEIIRQAGLLHDIGKIGIPEAILSKKGQLNEEEYILMRRHVEGSIAMIRYLPSLDYVIPSAIGHHERWDGTGYPRGIKGDLIPIGARCLCLADAFDAMISERSYRAALSVETALTEIKNNLGKQFDPELGAIFIRLVQEGKLVPKNRQPVADEAEASQD